MNERVNFKQSEKDEVRDTTPGKLLDILALCGLCLWDKLFSV